MAIITGQGTALQIGKETTWGTGVTPTQAVNFTSEGFKANIEYKEEDTLVGGTTSRNMDIMKKGVSWDMSVLAKPGNIGLLLGLAFGAEAEPVAESSGYKHSFTMLPPALANSLPSFSAVVDRHVACKKYTGCKVDSFSFTASAGDYIRLSFSGIGKEETSATKTAGLEIEQLKAFRFAGGTCTIDGTSFGSVTNVSFNLANALDGGEQTLGSGYFNTEPEPQKRGVTVSLDASYDSATEGIHANKFLTGTKASVVLKFVSPEEIATGENYSITITMPNVIVTECSPNVGGTDKIKLTISCTACEDVDDGDVVEAVTVDLVDDLNDTYL